MDNMVLQKVWQQGQRLTVDDLSGCAFTGENAAHTFEISGKNASGAVAISGTIAGKFLRSDNVTVPVTGTASDGVASITLTEDCYAVPGRFIFSVYANDGTHNICIYCGVGNVLRTDSGEYEGGEIIMDVTALMNAIETAVATIPADYSTLLAAIAPTFSTSTAYPAGSYVWYDGTMYKFTAAHAAGSWTGTDATAVILGTDLGSSLAELRSNDASISESKISYPESPHSKNGTEGQLLKSLGNGKTEWTNAGQPTDAQTATAVSAWLDAHPDATTTVDDFSLTNRKLVKGTLGFVTPEMFGAVGDGVTDDATAVQAAIDFAHANHCTFMGSGATYAVGSPINYVTQAQYAHPFIADFNGSTLKAINAMTEVLKSNTNTGSDTPGRYPRYILNLNVDGNGLVQYGIHDVFVRSLVVENVRISDVTDTCYRRDNNSIGGGGLTIDGLILDQNDQDHMNVTGIYIGVTDAKISNVRMRNMKTGMVLAGGSTYLYNVHPFLANANTFGNAIAFDVQANDQHFMYCYADTYDIGWNLNGKYCYFTDCHAYWNMTWYPVTTIPEILHFDTNGSQSQTYVYSFNASVGAYHDATVAAGDPHNVKFSNLAPGEMTSSVWYDLRANMYCNWSAIDNIPSVANYSARVANVRNIKTGHASVEFTSGGDTVIDVDIVFDSAFSTTPTIMLTPYVNSSKVEYASTGFVVKSKSASGFTLRAIRETATSFTAQIDWVAIE